MYTHQNPCQNRIDKTNKKVELRGGMIAVNENFFGKILINENHGG